MRTLLVPALASLLALPAFASAQSPATAHDDAAYGAHARASVRAAQQELAANPFDDAGVARPDVGPASRFTTVRIASGNSFDDAGLRFAEVVETAPAPLRVAGNTAKKADVNCPCHG